MAVKAMAPSDCGYVGCLFQHCMNDNVCPKATAKLLKSMDYARLCLIALRFRPQRYNPAMQPICAMGDFYSLLVSSRSRL